MNPREDSRRVVRQSGLTSVAALVAVLSGLGLDIVVAAAFGVGEHTDAFAVAARLPLGLMAMLMVVGNQALVPTFSTWLVGRERREVWRLVSATLVGGMLFGLLCAGLLAALAGPLTAVMAPGFEPEQRTLAARLAAVMVFVVPLTAGSETMRALLNARYSFFLPAMMTLVLNCVTAAIVLLFSDDITMLPVAYVIGAAAQFLVMLGFAHVKGFRLAPLPPLRHPEVLATAKLCVRPFVGAGLNPLARIVEIFFASFLPTGSATILHYGNRLISAIGGTVLFRSVIVAVVPRMSRAVAEGRHDDVRRLTLLGTRIMLLLSLPLTAAMAVLAEPGIRAVFSVGRFTADQAQLLGLAMAVYAASLVGSAVQRSLLSPFVASRDTRTPLRNTVYGLLANVLLLPLFVLPFRGSGLAVLGVALAFSLAQYVNVGHAWWRLHREFGVSLRPTGWPFLRTLAASALAAAAMLGTGLLLGIEGHALQRLALLGFTLLAGAVGLAVYVVAESAMQRRSPVALLRDVRRPGGGGEQA